MLLKLKFLKTQTSERSFNYIQWLNEHICFTPLPLRSILKPVRTLLTISNSPISFGVNLNPYPNSKPFHPYQWSPLTNPETLLPNLSNNQNKLQKTKNSFSAVLASHPFPNDLPNQINKTDHPKTIKKKNLKTNAFPPKIISNRMSEIPKENLWEVSVKEKV